MRCCHRLLLWHKDEDHARANDREHASQQQRRGDAEMMCHKAATERAKCSGVAEEGVSAATRGSALSSRGAPAARWTTATLSFG